MALAPSCLITAVTPFAQSIILADICGAGEHHCLRAVEPIFISSVGMSGGTSIDVRHCRILE
jgi:hypothetical protein